MEVKICFLLLLSLIAMALMFALTVQASASSAKIDASAIVYKVVDGDTFDAFPVGRVRLADVNAPEVGEPGYYEAKDFLRSLIYGRRVYLDVDDLYVMDKYNRLVCVVYVRYNSTHLLNVNKALLLEGLAMIRDYPNEFDPYTWELFVYHLVAALPETYDGLLQAYLELEANFQDLNTSYYELKASHEELLRNYQKLNSSYQKLKVAYHELKNDYDELRIELDSLKIAYDSLQTSHAYLKYAFIATIAAFMVAAVHLAKRRPKAVPRS
jgi:micrococcal nuclease